jgi:16S rRNA (guanine966-N2)-methyltransferase
VSPRIVGGAAGGRRLRVPVRGTRPTSDRVREALFNTLGGLIDLDGAAVLDLYAGSGAVGLEALSRGARRAVLVDDRSGPELTANVGAVGLPGAEVIRTTVARFLTGPPDGGFEGGFELVFADPPYELAEAELARTLAQLPPRLAPGAVVVVERSARSPEPSWPPPLAVIKNKRYGDATLWYRRAP